MGKIIVAGLGPGDMASLPLAVYQAIQAHEHIYLRTADHPAVAELKAEGFRFESYDAYYDQYSDFEDLYQAIVADLLKKADQKDILYLVPGHPRVAERTVALLLENKAGHELEILGGQSFIDSLFAAVDFDPVEGFQLVDAMDYHKDDLQPSQHLVIMQVFNDLIAGDLKLDLMEKYPDDQQIALVEAAGSKEEKVDWRPLYELDHIEGVHNLLSVYVPALAEEENTRSFSTVQKYVDAIFDPEGGDVWVLEQDQQSLLPYLEEETAEFIQAVEKKDLDNQIEELGDLLLQVLYHTNIAESQGTYSLEDVLDSFARKLRRRHPHVFDGLVAKTPEEVDRIWQEIKRQEREGEL